MKLSYYIIIFGLITAASCQKKLEVKDAPDFEVSTEASTYKVGDEVKFKITGNADIISFYSGEELNDYAFKDGRVVDVKGKGYTVSFRSSLRPGDPGPTQEDQLSVLYSTNFTGNYADLASVKSATWVDITDSFNFGYTPTFELSTDADLSDVVVPGKPIYFALKYVTRPQLENGFAQQWRIQDFWFKSKDSLKGNAIVIEDQLQMGFRIIDENPENAPARSEITDTRITLFGNKYKDPNDPLYDPENPIYDPKNPIYNPDSAAYVPGAKVPDFVPYDPDSPYNDPQSENWAVSGPVQVDQVDMGPDWAKSVRSSIYAARTTSYTYKYTQPGTYKAVFVVSNNSVDDTKQLVKEVTLTIVP